MRSTSIQCLLALVPALLLSMPVVSEAVPKGSEHDHHHAHSAVLSNLVLNEGKPWPTDVSLRTGMDAIGEAFDHHHAAYHDGTMSAEAYHLLADQVDEQVQYIFAHCNLPADADAQLHTLLAVIMGASHIMRSTNPSDGMPELHRAIRAYGEYFDHPGWSE